MPATVKTTNIQEPSSSVVNISLASSGDATVNQNLTVSVSTTSSGQLITNNLYLNNSSTNPQIQFQSGTLLTTPVAGSMEYDGKLFYSTFQSNRGLLDGSYIYALNSTYNLSNPTGTSNWVAGLGVTLDANVCYLFEGTLAFQKTGGSASVAVALGFGGTISPFTIGYSYVRYYSTTGFAVANTTPAGMAYVETTAQTTTMSGNTAATQYHVYLIKGIMNPYTSSGTFIPQISGFGTGATVTMQVGSYFKITPLAGSGYPFNSYVGTWA